MPYNRQAKFERFLDSQQAREQANWFRCLPQVMTDLVLAIKMSQAALEGTDKAEKFEQNSAGKLRSMYKQVRVIQEGSARGYDEFTESQRIVKDMISQVNSWFRSTKVACGLKATRDAKFYGKASIVEKYELIISDDFKATANQW